MTDTIIADNELLFVILRVGGHSSPGGSISPGSSARASSRPSVKSDFFPGVGVVKKNIFATIKTTTKNHTVFFFITFLNFSVSELNVQKERKSFRDKPNEDITNSWFLTGVQKGTFSEKCNFFVPKKTKSPML